MSEQSIVLNLPEPVYEQIRQAAEKAHRPLNELLVEAVLAVAPISNTLTNNKIRSSLAQMAYLNDAALWQAARATMSQDQRENLEALHFKQQAETLTPEEKTEEQALMELYRETILVRAQAAILLKQRGYDISNLSQFMLFE